MFKLPELPYDYDALEPAISADTLHLHHDKHHRTYVETTNQLIEEQRLTPQTLEALIRACDGKLFDNAAQAWNHAFFWECMTPDHSAPGREVEGAVKATFGGLAGLKKAFVEEGAHHFGSGWVWLVTDTSGTLKVISTHDGDTPLVHRKAPILVCDVWEHAYYLDYQNDRKAYLEAWFDKLANWRFAENQLRALRGAGEPFRYPAPEDDLAQTPNRNAAHPQTGAGAA